MRTDPLTPAGSSIVRVDGYRATCVEGCPWVGELRDEWDDAAADLAGHCLHVHVAPFVDAEGRWTARR